MPFAVQGTKGFGGAQVTAGGIDAAAIVRPEKVNDDQMTILAHEIAKKIESNMDYPGQIKVNLIRENRAVDYAK